MAKTRVPTNWRGFPASLDAHGVSRADATLPARRPGVRKSGRRPADDPDVLRGACWHHDTADECAAAVAGLSLHAEARTQAAIGAEMLVWLHATRESGGRIPHRSFLERFDRSRLWERVSPAFGLPRAAVFHHLADDAGGRTIGDRFRGSPLALHLCVAERAWLDAERTARLSFWWVSKVGPSSFRINDCFPGLAGGESKAVELPYGEIAPGEVTIGQTMFVRVVTWRGEPVVGTKQYAVTRVATTAPVSRLCASAEDLDHPPTFARELFEAWGGA